eukprot:1194139-Prorocentrum_minimum.AAC.1
MKKKLGDVEDLTREAKAKTKESRKMVKMTHDGVTANTVTLANITPGMHEGFGMVLAGQDTLKIGQKEIKDMQETGLETL